jgi:hypothetical protein
VDFNKPFTPWVALMPWLDKSAGGQTWGVGYTRQSTSDYLPFDAPVQANVKPVLVQPSHVTG